MSTGKIIQKGIREVFKLSVKDHYINGYNKLLEEWGVSDSDVILQAILDIKEAQGVMSNQITGLHNLYYKNGFLSEHKQMQTDISEVKTKIDTHIKLTRKHVKRKWRLGERILAICAICLPLSVSIIALIIAV